MKSFSLILPILFLSIAFTQTKRNFTNPYHCSQFETLIADAADAAIVPMSSKHIFMNRTNTIRYLHNAELAWLALKKRMSILT